MKYLLQILKCHTSTVYVALKKVQRNYQLVILVCAYNKTAEQ